MALDEDFAALFPDSARPVLRRDAFWCAVGADVLTVYCGLPPHEIAVTPCSSTDVEWLTSLDGLIPWSAAVARARQTRADRAGTLIRALVRTGALDDASSMPASWRLSGAREVSDRSGLLSAGLSPWSANALIDRRHASVVAVVGLGRPAELAFTWCTAAGLDCRRVDALEHDRPPTTRIAMLVEPGHPLVVSDVDTSWHAIPHLPVRCWGTYARVGPLVRPGISGCLRCAHLHDSDRFMAWPQRSWQAANAVRAAPTEGFGGWDSATGHLALALAVRILRSACDADDHPVARSGIAYDIVDGEALPRPVQQPPHPLCGCQWDRVGLTA